MKPDNLRRKQQSNVFVALLLFAFVLLVIQLWLLTGSLEQFIVGEDISISAGAVISTGIFLINLWMLLGVQKIDSN